MICYNCGLKLRSENEKECLLCGTKFAKQCLSCKFPNPKTSKFCLNCGVNLVKTELQSSIQNYELLTENRKNVAVIFADVSGFTALSEKMDPEEVRDIINDCFTYITKPVYEFEGTIDKYIGDCVMILFGAKYTHSDDAKRSVICAIKMMQLIKEFSQNMLSSKDISLNLSIGINFGLVVTGSIGNYFDKDYTVMGDIVNTAQRLQSNAGKGAILVSESVYTETKDAIEYSKPLEILAKNKGAPIKCYSPHKLKANYLTQKETFFTGREYELDTIASIYKNIQKTGTQFILLVGDAGMGKTLLIKEFLNKISLDTKKTWTDCSAAFQERAYYTLCNVLIELMNINSEDSTSVKQNRLLSFLDYILGNYSDEERKRAYNFIGLILGFSRDNDFQNILNSMSFDNIQREILKQISIFFTNLCKKQKVIIIVDDIHWADANSIFILKELSQKLSSANALFIFTSRYEIDEFKNISQQNFTTLTLESLSENEIRAFICNYFEASKVDTELFNLILKVTNRNSLYIQEFVSHIKKAEKCYIKNNTVYIHNYEIASLPNSIQSLILANISELGDDTKNFLQIASVVGKEFNMSLVSNMQENSTQKYDIFKLPLQLNIISLKSVYTISGEIERVFIFNHDTEREVIYDSILNKNKILLHKKILEYIESKYDKNIEKYYDILCMHANKANIPKKTLEYYFKAANFHKINYNLKNSLLYFKNFLEYAENYSDKKNDSRVFESLLNMGQIDFTLANYELALNDLNKAYLCTDSSDQKYTAQIFIADAYKELGKYEIALDTVNEIYNSIKHNSNIYGKLLRMKSEILRITGNPEALDFAKKSEKILLKVEDYQNLSETANQIGILYFIKGNVDKSLVYFNKSYKYAEKINNLEMISKISGNMAIIYYNTAMVSKSFDFFTKSIEVSKEISDLQGYISGNINLGILHLHKGSFDKAEQLFNESLKNSYEISSKLNECMILTNIGDIMYERGVYDAALNFYHKSLALALDINVPTGEAINYLALAKICILQQLNDQVPYILKKAYDIINDVGEIEYLVDYYRLTGLYYLNIKETNSALEACEKAIDTAVQLGNERRKLQSLQTKSDVLLALQKENEALKSISEAILISKNLESDYESAKNHYSKFMILKSITSTNEAQNELVKAINYIKNVDACSLKQTILNTGI